MVQPSEFVCLGFAFVILFAKPKEMSQPKHRSHKRAIFMFPRTLHGLALLLVGRFNEPRQIFCPSGKILLHPQTTKNTETKFWNHHVVSYTAYIPALARNHFLLEHLAVAQQLENKPHAPVSSLCVSLSETLLRTALLQGRSKSKKPKRNILQLALERAQISHTTAVNWAKARMQPDLPCTSIEKQHILHVWLSLGDLNNGGPGKRLVSYYSMGKYGKSSAKCPTFSFDKR